jgi:thiol-disulfide isomerase/thioredoxin
MRAKKLRRGGVWFFCALAITLLLAQNYVLPKEGFKPFALKTLEGSPKTLQDYLNRATLVTFFFPTCGYCNGEFPHLQKIYDKYKDQGFSLVSINIMPDQNSLIADWLSSHQYKFPVLIGATLEALQKDYDLRATPTHFLLDSKGKVLLKQTGYKAGDEKILEDKIQKALSPAS